MSVLSRNVFEMRLPFWNKKSDKSSLIGWLKLKTYLLSMTLSLVSFPCFQANNNFQRPDVQSNTWHYERSESLISSRPGRCHRKANCIMSDWGSMVHGPTLGKSTDNGSHHSRGFLWCQRLHWLENQNKKMPRVRIINKLVH